MLRARSRRLAAACSLAAVLAPASGGWAQPAAVPAYPPGADFAGVAGSAAETTRIAALCGANRNAADGYAPAPAFPGQTKAPVVHGTQGYAVESVAKIDRPFGMDFLPDGRMLVSFRAGGMRIVTREGVVSDLLTGVPEITGARIGSGMFDVLADRDFARNRTVYFTFHTKLASDTKAMGRIARARLSADGKALEDVKVLREGADIQPRRVLQMRDGTLLIFSFGDLADVGGDPQELASQAGKVLRIGADGSVPKDNPFVSDAKANPAVWALGFRDVHAAAVDPRDGRVWEAENAPRGGDELNLIRRGKNYGFPVISYGRQNSGAMINGGKTAQEGMEQPLYYWNPSIAPSGLAVYTGKALPAWRGDLFIGGMSGQQLVRLQMRGERVVGEEKLLMDRCQRFKVVKQGPDGDLYVLTDETAPKSNEILRLVPAKTVPAPRQPKTAAAARPAGAAGAP